MPTFNSSTGLAAVIRILCPALQIGRDTVVIRLNTVTGYEFPDFRHVADSV